MDSSLLALFLPDGLLERFDFEGAVELCAVKTKLPYYRIFLSEKNILPEGYSSLEYESKGFCSTKDVQDFPIRGKAVILEIKRRCWRQKQDKNIVIASDLSFLAQGAKFTKELSDFLKGTD